MKSGPKTPLRKHSLADTLAQRLQRRIAAGKFRTGERLPTESELMRMFGVGRSTVREAVRMLSDRGFLNVRQGAGTFVAAPAASDALVEQRLRRTDIRELDEVRKILEAAIVERAAARRSDNLRYDMERIESLLAQRGTAAEEGDLERCIAADIVFHAAIAEATHNEILSELYRTTTGHLQKGFRHIYRDTACFRASQPTHARLARNIADTDVQQALDTIAVILDEP